MKLSSIYILFVIVLGGLINPVQAQKPKGSYKGNKQAIQQAYEAEMREIASRKNVPTRQKKLQRDAAIDRYLADKRANRQAFRKNTDPNRGATEKRNRGSAPKLRKN
jgi:hypothetical protein